tara:strand:+ start:2951 stop:3190 length:240 start_codon:yes stop_codon:yes gene_type:complete
MKQKCFEKYKIEGKNCQKKNCRYWMDCSKFNNCCIIGAKSSEKITLQNIGEIFSVTRMRICQIEKVAVKKLREKINSLI